MLDQFSPPGWFLRPNGWPYWMPGMLPGHVPMQPQLPRMFDDQARSESPHSTTPPSGGFLASLAQPSKSVPSWTRSAMPAVLGGGLLATLGEPKSSAASGGLLKSLAQSIDEPPADPWTRLSRHLGAAVLNELHFRPRSISVRDNATPTDANAPNRLNAQ